MKTNLFVGLLLCFAGVINASKCLNNRGEEVYWWVMLITPSSAPSIRYAYYDSNSAGSAFDLLTTDPSDPNSALARTLTQINTQNL